MAVGATSSLHCASASRLDVNLPIRRVGVVPVESGATGPCLGFGRRAVEAIGGGGGIASAVGTEPSSSLFFLSAPLLDAGGAVDARRRESASSANITLGASATALSMSCRNGGRRVRFTLRDRNRRLHAVGPAQ